MIPVTKVVCHAINDDEDYRDANIYIVDSDGSEWCMRVTLDKEKDSVYEGQPEYAEDQDDCFDVTDIEPPPHVQEALDSVRDMVYTFVNSKEVRAADWIGQEKVYQNVSGDWLEV